MKKGQGAFAITVDKDIEYAYNGSQLLTMKYPDEGIRFTYYYDSMSRPIRMTGPGYNQNTGNPMTLDYVNTVSYNNVNNASPASGRRTWAQPTSLTTSATN